MTPADRHVARVKRGEHVRAAMKAAGQGQADLARRCGMSATGLRDQLYGAEKLGPEVEACLWSTARVALCRRLLEEAEVELDDIHQRGGVQSATLRAAGAVGSLSMVVDEAQADGVIDADEHRMIAAEAGRVEIAAGRVRREAEEHCRRTPDVNTNPAG